MTNLELAKKLVALLGGKSNVEKAAHCMTRLRVTCKDSNRVNEKEIKECEGVLGLVVEGNSYQIVLGPGKVKKSHRYLYAGVRLAESRRSWLRLGRE